MNIFVDIAFIVGLLIAIYKGYKKGLMVSLISLIAIFVIFLGVYFLTIPITNYLMQKTEVPKKIENFFIRKSEEIKENKNDNEEKSEIDDIIEKKSSSVIKKETNKLVKNNLIPAILRIAVGCIIFILLKLIFFILIKFVFADFGGDTFVGEINKIFGMIFSVVEYLIVVLVILSCLNIYNKFIGENKVKNDVTNSINKTYIIKVLNNNNFISEYLMSKIDKKK